MNCHILRACIPKTEYGYNFTRVNSGGLGAMMYAILLAYIYAEENDYTFLLEEEGYDIPRFNGGHGNHDHPDKKYWHSYFRTLQVGTQSRCKKSWPDLIIPFNFRQLSIDIYRKYAASLFQLHPNVDNEIRCLIAATPFNKSTDVVVHIRRTDKVDNFTPTGEPNRFKEAISLPIAIYAEDCRYILRTMYKDREDVRLYVCTDDMSVCEQLQKMLDDVEVVWDTSESSELNQYKRFDGSMSMTEAQEETMRTFKNLYIMREALFLLGARSSYLFRMAELLRTDESFNVQDNNKFGAAEYIPQMPFRSLQSRAIHDLFHPNIQIDVAKTRLILNSHGCLVIPSMLRETRAFAIVEELDRFEDWYYAILHKIRCGKPCT